MRSSYRMVAAVDLVDGDVAFAHWRPSGCELGDAARLPPEVPPWLMLEALAQCAGLTLRARDGRPDGHWLLGAVNDARFGAAPWEAELELRCEIVRGSGRAASVEVSARSPAGKVCAARLLMVRAAPGTAPGTPGTVPGAS